MKTGEVIRMYRKNRNLTQEEMASRLGVTAPAVNKWENNVSLPDITLLAPIARLLETTPSVFPGRIKPGRSERFCAGSR